MNITVNGEPRTVPEILTVGDLIEQLDLTGRRLAVEVNKDIVPRSQHPRHQLKQDDVVEVVHAIGGG